MGCAAAMAVLIDDSLVHGPIQALFTVDEEQGLTGANGLQPGFVSGEILLNLDSEEHGQLVIGCAGGKITVCRLPYEPVAADGGLKWYELHLDHFKGGHSGMEIGLGRGNANQQLARFIWEWQQECRMEVASIDGGNLANAIPRECKALVGVREECAADFEKRCVNSAICSTLSSFWLKNRRLCLRRLRLRRRPL